MALYGTREQRSRARAPSSWRPKRACAVVPVIAWVVLASSEWAAALANTPRSPVVAVAGDRVDSDARHGYVDEIANALSDAMPEEPFSPSSALQPREPVAASEGPLVLVGAATAVSLNVSESSCEIVEDAAISQTRRLIVSVDGIEAEQDPGLAYAVYLETPSGGRQHIGNMSLFGIQDINAPNRAADGAAGLRHIFDATDAVNALRVQGAFDARSITVTFEPIRVLPPPGEQFPADMENPEPGPPVRIGRVSLFVS